MMGNFKSDISIFLSESVLLIGAYSIFALIVCSVFAGLEFHNQSADIASLRIVVKAATLLVSTIILFTLSLYMMGWKSDLLGGEMATSIIFTIIWFILLYLMNSELISWCGLSFEKTNSYNKYLPLLILISPFALFNIFVFVIGNAWRN